MKFRYFQIFIHNHFSIMKPPRAPLGSRAPSFFSRIIFSSTWRFASPFLCSWQPRDFDFKFQKKRKFSIYEKKSEKWSFLRCLPDFQAVATNFLRFARRAFTETNRRTNSEWAKKKRIRCSARSAKNWCKTSRRACSNVFAKKSELRFARNSKKRWWARSGRATGKVIVEVSLIHFVRLKLENAGQWQFLFAENLVMQNLN